MTLGGLSLAVGILVDDATVEIENVHRNMAMKKPHRAGHPRRRAADRRARVRRDALHLHRLHPGRVHLGRGALALHAARDGGRLRDDDVVLPVAHARADDGALPARAGDRPLRRRRRHDARSATSSGACTSASTCHFERLRRALRRLPRLGARSRARSSRLGFARLRRRCRSRLSSRTSGATSSPRSTPGRFASTCGPPPARASRRPSSSSRASRTIVHDASSRRTRSRRSSTTSACRSAASTSRSAIRR